MASTLYKGGGTKLLMKCGPLYSHMCFLTHWSRVTHICVGKLTIIGSDNGLSPGRRQAVIWTNAGILLIGHWGTNFSESLIGIHTFSFKKIHLKMSSAKWRPFCLGLNVLMWLIDIQIMKFMVEIMYFTTFNLDYKKSLNYKQPWWGFISKSTKLVTTWVDVINRLWRNSTGHRWIPRKGQCGTFVFILASTSGWRNIIPAWISNLTLL